MEERIVKNTFQKFFLPTLTASITLSVISMTDLIIAGWFVGEDALTSISLALPVIIFVQIIAASFGTGGAIALSAKLGEGDLPQCSRIFTVSILSAGAIGVVVCVLGTIFLEPIILLCGGSPGAVMAGAKDYIGTLFLGMPFMILSPVMTTYLRNDNEQKYSMLCVMTCGLFNIIFSAVFAAVLHFGIAGIAWATVLSQILSCILAGRKLFRGRRMFHLVKVRPSRSLYFSILKPGLPVASIFLSQVILTVVINRILMTEAASQGVAVYAVIKYLINFMYALFDGVTGSIQPMLGIYYGEREQQNILYTVRCSLTTMAAIALGMFLLMEIGGKPLCRLFGVASGTLTELTVSAMHMEAICCLTAGIITYINAFYRCTGNEKISFLLSIGDNLVFPISSLLLLTRVFSLGINGVWWGLVLGGFCTIICWLAYCLCKRKGFLLLDQTQFTRPEDEYHIIYPATNEQLKTLLAGVEGYCFEQKIPLKKEYYITLSIEELVVNVVGLANEDSSRNKKEYYVDIRISPHQDGGIGLRIRDNLTEFNPGDLSTDDMKSLALKTDSSAVNELGIGLVKKIAKDYNYKRTIGFNNFSVTLP
ncbi:MAG: MATE family efflux transporter [Blautia sp.]|jgi:Na+-driven multidrug efflux pump/anti-sigma regulatory factor (Ser/Thr protein kinase)